MMSTNRYTADKPLKIALVNPLSTRHVQTSGPPLGLGYLKKYYECYGKHRDSVVFRLFDENARPGRLKDVLSWRPHVVGISVMSGVRDYAFEFAKRCREEMPETFILGGGVHFHAEPQDGVDARVFDAVCTGEGEEPLRVLIDDVWQEQGGGVDALSRVPNLAWRDPAQNEIKRSPAWRFDALDTLDLPDIEFFDTAYYLAPKPFGSTVSFARYFVVITGRGCPFQCTYCHNSFRDGGVRYHDLKKIVNYLVQAKKKYGVHHIMIWDDLFFLDRQRVLEFCTMVRREVPDLRWWCQARASLIREEDESVFRTMVESGCDQVSFGLESGSDEVLSRIKGGGASVAQNQLALDMAQKAGMSVAGSFMCGIPGETEDQMAETETFIRRHLSKMAMFYVFICTPYPGTKMFNDLQREGVLDASYYGNLADNMTGEGHVRVYNKCVSAKKVVDFVKRMRRLGLERYPWHQRVMSFARMAVSNPKFVWRRVKAIYGAGEGDR